MSNISGQERRKNVERFVSLFWVCIISELSSSICIQSDEMRREEEGRTEAEFKGDAPMLNSRGTHPC